MSRSKTPRRGGQELRNVTLEVASSNPPGHGEGAGAGTASADFLEHLAQVSAGKECEDEKHISLEMEMAAAYTARDSLTTTLRKLDTLDSVTRPSDDGVGGIAVDKWVPYIRRAGRLIRAYGWVELVADWRDRTDSPMIGCGLLKMAADGEPGDSIKSAVLRAEDVGALRRFRWSLVLNYVIGSIDAHLSALNLRRREELFGTKTQFTPESGVGVQLEVQARSTGLEGVVRGDDCDGDQTREHASNFEWVVWGRLTFTFVGAECAVVRELWKCWEACRPGLAQQTLLEAAGSDGKRLRDVFKHSGVINQAWRSLIVPVEGRKGMYTLADQPKPQRSHKSPT